MNYYIGLDLGGTQVKGVITDKSGKIYAENSVNTEAHKGGDAVCENMAKLARILVQQAGIAMTEVCGIGVGAPGSVDSETGVVVYANNLDFNNYPLAENLKNKLDVQNVRVTNDANAAALGEAVFGIGKEYKDVVLITLGTGVGGGIIIGGKIFEGNRSAGAEIGHMILVSGGLPCSCGARGCFEAYSSATALIRDTKIEMQKNPNSLLWKAADGKLDNVNGKTVWDAAKMGDRSAKKVVRRYVKYLGDGITSIANVFRPEAIMLGGGICKQGDNLVKPLQKRLDRQIYGGDSGPRVPILIASLGNTAGSLGAAALVME